MTIPEIIYRLQAGETVEIRTADAMEFMRGCEDYDFTEFEIQMMFDGPKCTIRLPELAADLSSLP